MTVSEPPPYNYLEHYICNLQDVRDMVMKLPTSVIDTEGLERIAFETYSIIRTLSDKDDWQPTDREFGGFALLNKLMTVAVAWKYFGRTDEARAAGSSMYDEQTSLLNTMVQNLDTTTGEVELVISRTPRKGWNSGEGVEVPRGNLTV